MNAGRGAEARIPGRRRAKGEGFFQIPAWYLRRMFPAIETMTGKKVTVSHEFREAPPLALAVLNYISRRLTDGDRTPFMTCEEMAHDFGVSRRSMKKVLDHLSCWGVIRRQTDKRRTRFLMVFRDPHDHVHQQAGNRDSFLDASVDTRSQSSLCARAAQNHVANSTQPVPSRHTTPADDMPNWDVPATLEEIRLEAHYA